MLIILLLGVGLAWWLSCVLYKKNWNKKLSVLVEFTDSYAYQGEASALREVIINDKALPLPALEVRLSMNRNLEFEEEAKENSNVTDQSYKRDIFSFLLHQQVTRTLAFRCRKRGFYHITKAEVVGYDLFFGSGHYMEVPQQTHMYVYPAQIDVRRIRLICQALSGRVVVQNRLYPDPFEFSGIREYRQDDPMNHINWKASARSQELMVNQYDSTTSIEVTVILDVEDRNILKYEKLTEEGISIVSSLAAAMVRNKMELNIISNGKAEDSSQGLYMHMKAGGGRVAELNQRLACIDTGCDVESIAEVLRREAAKKKSGHIYLLVSKNQTAENMEALRILAMNNSQVLWVIPVHPSMEMTYAGEREIHLMRWEVE